VGLGLGQSDDAGGKRLDAEPRGHHARIIRGRRSGGNEDPRAVWPMVIKPPMTEADQTIDTSDASGANTPAGDIDAMLNELSNSTGETTPQTENGSADNPPASAQEPETSEESSLSAEEAEPAASAVAAETDSPTAADAADPEAALDQVDRELADLEGMLADTVAEMEAESASQPAAADSEPQPPQSKASDEGPGELPWPEPPGEASTLTTAQDEPIAASPLDEDPAAVGGSGGIDAPPSGEEAVGPTPDKLDDEPAQAAQEQPLQPTDEVGTSEPAAPPTSRVWMLTARLGRRLAAAVAATLVTLDRPFRGLKPGTKTILAFVGIATLAVAIATWVVGSFLPRM